MRVITTEDFYDLFELSDFGAQAVVVAYLNYPEAPRGLWCHAVFVKDPCDMQKIIDATKWPVRKDGYHPQSYLVASRYNLADEETKRIAEKIEEIK